MKVKLLPDRGVFKKIEQKGMAIVILPLEKALVWTITFSSFASVWISARTKDALL